MKHISNEELIKYKNNLLTEDESEKIDDHIYLCDYCLNSYLSLINTDIDYLDEDFTKETIELIATTNMDLLKDKTYSKDLSLEYETKIIKIQENSYKNKKSKNKSVKTKIIKNNNKKKLDNKFFIKYALVAASIILITFTGAFTNENLDSIKSNIIKEENINIVYQGSSLITEKITNIFVKVASPRYASNINRGDGNYE